MSKLTSCYPFRSPEARDRYLAYYDAVADSWPLESARSIVTTAEGQTCVWVTGRESCPPLVLLPGAWAHALMWPPSLIETLSERYRTYAVDNICDVGRSVSSRPLRTAGDFTTWLDGLFDGLGLSDGINLMGISRGGWITGEYMLHAPERLRRAVLLSPALVVAGPSLKSIRSSHYSIASAIAPSRWSVAGLMRHLMPYYARSQPRAFEQYVADTTLALQSFDIRKVCSFWGPRVLSDDELRSIRIPALYMAGEHETMSSVTTAVARINAIAPAFDTAIFPDAGHDLVDVRTADVASAISAFLCA